jgi:hypothetical protein
MKKVLRIILILIIVVGTINGIDEIILEEITNPKDIYVNDNKIYISEKTSICIYSLKDFSLISKFGRIGEGPDEFKIQIGKMVFLKNMLAVNSIGRITYFRKNGDFLECIKVVNISPMMNFYPINGGSAFVGLAIAQEGNNLNFTVNIYDQEFGIHKTILTLPNVEGGKLHFFNSKLAVNSYFVENDKIYILGDEASSILVFNTKGKIVQSIKHDFIKVKFTKNDQDMLFKSVKNQIHSFNVNIKDKIIFPENYPAVIMFYVSKKIIYLIGYKRKSNQIVNYLKCYNLNGQKLLEKTVFINKIDELTPDPFTIDNWNLYQLKENEEDNWELHINPIK